MFKNKKILYSVISTIGVAIIAIGIILGYRAYINSQTEEGSKEITVQVVVDGEVEDEYNFRTDAEFLGIALDEQELITAQDSEYGRFLTGVGDIHADSSQQQWWHISKNDTAAEVGIDDLAIKDGDVIVLELKTGW